ncbi:MAG: pantoate--beta-alanine ligase [Bacteroidales bacterium]|nr:MAG: pantoate--beta-alanine ligase [Bacteroidales bacterium]
MEVIAKTSEVKNVLTEHRSKGESIGFVPTMGALHRGHISLVEKAVSDNNIVVVSIFVNPTQFNDTTDLKNYPRTPDRDMKILEKSGVHYIYMPSEQEIYPDPDTRVFDFGKLDKVMEGEHRPGHFNGVAQVVSKLFDIVEPHRAYFGQKDFQQLAIIRQLVKLLNLKIEIVPCPIVRENDGLAMSSRNLLLEPSIRQSAPLIFKTLSDARNKGVELSVKELISWVVTTINKDNNLTVEYFSLADSITLQPILNWNDSESIIGCIAVRAGKIRLIDNAYFK